MGFEFSKKKQTISEAEVAQLESEHKALKHEMNTFIREIRKDEIAVKEQGPAFLEKKLGELTVHAHEELPEDERKVA